MKIIVFLIKCCLFIAYVIYFVSYKCLESKLFDFKKGFYALLISAADCLNFWARAQFDLTGLWKHKWVARYVQKAANCWYIFYFNLNSFIYTLRISPCSELNVFSTTCSRPFEHLLKWPNRPVLPAWSPDREARGTLAPLCPSRGGEPSRTGGLWVLRPKTMTKFGCHTRLKSCQSSLTPILTFSYRIWTS